MVVLPQWHWIMFYYSGSYIPIRFKIELKFSITHETACARGQSLPQSLNNKLLFYFTTVQSEINRTNSKICLHVCVPVCAYMCVWVGSGYCQAVYLIEKPVLWSREASSISQCYASFLQYCLFPQTMKYIQIHVHPACMHSYSISWFILQPQTPNFTMSLHLQWVTVWWECSWVLYWQSK